MYCLGISRCGEEVLILSVQLVLGVLVLSQLRSSTDMQRMTAVYTCIVVHTYIRSAHLAPEGYKKGRRLPDRIKWLSVLGPGAPLSADLRVCVGMAVRVEIGRRLKTPWSRSPVKNLAKPSHKPRGAKAGRVLENQLVGSFARKSAEALRLHRGVADRR